MKKYHLAPADCHGTPLFELGGDEIAAYIFAELEAQRYGQLTEQQAAVLILRYPADRPACQRLCDWWHSCERRHVTPAPDVTVKTATEPEWKGHWAVVKYL